METIGVMGWQQFGLIGLISGAIVLILFFVIKWVLNTTNKIIENNNDEREKWFGIFTSMSASVNNQNNALVEFRRQVAEAHGYQKQEHEKVLENQGKIATTLTSAVEAIGRINGFKK
ncbi:MAG: hypothetical protein KJ864_02335 [Candidatus Omnitrophica bacterium]|nr:hypothetical protein [Candidatus Omnitrophota bacterium]MBU1895090.1 hypothetical protein [Candidatus Omnitrophota bacterium]